MRCRHDEEAAPAAARLQSREGAAHFRTQHAELQESKSPAQIECKTKLETKSTTNGESKNKSQTKSELESKTKSKTMRKTKGNILK